VLLALFRAFGWLLERANSLSAALIGLFPASAHLYLSSADPVLERFVAATYSLAVQGFEVLCADPPYVPVSERPAVAVDLGSPRSNLASSAEAGQRRL
jgi:hypothetical protein